MICMSFYWYFFLLGINSDFKISECMIKLLIFGEIGLVFFIEVVIEENGDRNFFIFFFMI